MTLLITLSAIGYIALGCGYTALAAYTPPRITRDDAIWWGALLCIALWPILVGGGVIKVVGHLALLLTPKADRR